MRCMYVLEYKITHVLYKCHHNLTYMDSKRIQ